LKTQVELTVVKNGIIGRRRIKQSRQEQKERVNRIVLKDETKLKKLRQVPKKRELVMKKKCKAKTVVEMLGGPLVGVVLLTTILAYTPALAQLRDYNPQGLKATTLEEVLVLPEEEIDLTTAILILYKEWDPNFDVTGSLEEIDRMALELEVRISPQDSPERIVSVMNRYLFAENAYSASDSADPYYMEMLENSALPRVIDNKEGNCLGLSLLYLALAERLGLPFYGVAAPKHMFVRYDDGKKRINIETTDKGEKYEDSYYEKLFMLHSTYRNHGFYLKNLRKREVVEGFLHTLGVAYGTRGMHNKAIAKFRKAIEINPDYAEAHYNLGVAYSMKGMYDEEVAEYRKAIELHPNYAEAHYNLGLVYGMAGMLDEAIAKYKKVLEINPNLAEAHNNLAVAYYLKGEYGLAIEHCDKVIELGYRVHPQFLEDLKPYRQK